MLIFIELLFSSAVDEYGFERRDDFDYDSYEDFMSVYLKVLVTRAQKWAALLGEGKSIKRTNTIKRYVRKGIPSESLFTHLLLTIIQFIKSCHSVPVATTDTCIQRSQIPLTK